MATPYFTVGPRHIFLGNPTTAAGAGMTYAGYTHGDVKFTPGIQMSFGQLDQTGATPRADAVFRSGIKPMVSAPLVDETKALLALLFHGASVVTASSKTAVGYGSGFSKIALANIPTICLLPMDQTGSGTNGIDSVDAIWLPGAACSDFGEFTFTLPGEGDDTVFNPRETKFTGLLRPTDHAGTAIPASGQVVIHGPPASHGLTWFLPAVP